MTAVRSKLGGHKSATVVFKSPRAKISARTLRANTAPPDDGRKRKQCEHCNRWVLTRANGELRGHQSNTRGISCRGGNPTTGQ